MKNEQKFGDLKPRAIAVLVALRSGALTDTQIRARIGERRTDDTVQLLHDMRDLRLVIKLASTGRWYLDHDGLGWLQDHGLDAVPGAKIWRAELDAHMERMQPTIDAINEGMAAPAVPCDPDGERFCAPCYSGTGSCVHGAK